MTPRRASTNSPARRKVNDDRLWRVVEGAVVDAMKSHPEYVTEAGAKTMAQSITKRVIGNLKSAFADGRASG
jgi:hypothetical protein